MIILDTNVVSEIIKTRPEPAVLAWLDRQPNQEVAITAITLMELRVGIELLQSGQRRDALETALRQFIDETIGGRVAAFDATAAEATGRLLVARRNVGRNVDLRDSQIAGIAMAHSAALATRNGRHFADAPIDVIDPWKYRT